LKKLIVIRGLPGSGKSTLARSFGGTIFSTDDFFMIGGKYCFDKTMLTVAHTQNQQNTEKAMAEQTAIVVIDNTNILRVHIQPYLELAEKHGYHVSYAVPQTPWAFNVQECAKRCIHNIPEYVIQRMLDNWEQIE
jgi:predicted kinase